MILLARHYSLHHAEHKVNQLITVVAHERHGAPHHPNATVCFKACSEQQKKHQGLIRMPDEHGMLKHIYRYSDKNDQMSSIYTQNSSYFMLNVKQEFLSSRRSFWMTSVGQQRLYGLNGLQRNSKISMFAFRQHLCLLGVQNRLLGLSPGPRFSILKLSH